MLHLQAILESHNKRQHIAPAALTRNKLLARVAGVKAHIDQTNGNPL